MPEISRFYGIIIFMNFFDHAPPHFHAWYGDYQISMTIEDGLIRGEMPQRALMMIYDWLAIHKHELLAEWNNAQNGLPLNKIAPLS